MNDVLRTLTSTLKTIGHDLHKDFEAFPSETNTLDKVGICSLGAALKIENNGVCMLVANLISELAKVESNRPLLSIDEILLPLIRLTRGDDSLQYQACRAIGNICYENEKGREIIGKDGVEGIIAVIRHSNEVPVTPTCNLGLVSIGCLMNLINSNDILQVAAFNYDVVPVLENRLRKDLTDFKANDSSILHTLIILNMIIQHMNDTWLSESFCCLIVDTLRKSDNPEISVLCLENLYYQSENDDIKLILAKKDACQLVFQLVEENKSYVQDEDSRSLLKLACDLIVLVLNGDAAMELLYNNGSGAIVNEVLKWFELDDTDLLCTSVICIGNFARNDKNCVKLVDSGLADKLLSKLKHFTPKTPESDPEKNKILYALLSALRNLSIAPANKTKLLGKGLIEILMDLTQSDFSPITFKLLGTLRMVTDGQSPIACRLINEKNFLENLMKWYTESDHLGIRGETSRLLACLIKNYRPESELKQHPILRVNGTIECLIDMIASLHTVMQNEALLALILVASQCGPTDFQSLSEQCVNANIGSKIIIFLDHTGSDTESDTAISAVSPELLSNMLVLMNNLSKSPDIISNLRTNKVDKQLKNAMAIKQFKDLYDIIQSVIKVFDL